MSSFSSWGALGGPGEACVKLGGKSSTLGGFAKKVHTKAALHLAI